MWHTQWYHFFFLLICPKKKLIIKIKHKKIWVIFITHTHTHPHNRKINNNTKIVLQFFFCFIEMIKMWNYIFMRICDFLSTQKFHCVFMIIIYFFVIFLNQQQTKDISAFTWSYLNFLPKRLFCYFCEFCFEYLPLLWWNKQTVFTLK